MFCQRILKYVCIGISGVVGAYWKRLGRLGGDLVRRGGALGAFVGRHNAANSVLRASSERPRASKERF